MADVMNEGCFIGDGEREPINWKLGKLISREVNTNIYLVDDFNNLQTKQCVVKRAFISDDIDPDSECMITLLKELGSLRDIQHRTILAFIGFSRNGNVLSLFLPYMDKGSLELYIKNDDSGHLTERMTAWFTLQILDGLQYLHEKRISHRDIKGSNVLMKNDYEIQISDFGVSKILNTLSKPYTTEVGTENLMAPELFNVGEHDYYKADIWSLGCIVYQMITGSKLTKEKVVSKELSNDLELSFPKHLIVSTTIKDFLHLMIKKNPADRLKASELMQTKFITNLVSTLIEFLRLTYMKNRADRYNETELKEYTCINNTKFFKEYIFKEYISIYFTGTYEVQECLEGKGEADLPTYLANCEKNPGHEYFVPVNQLSIDHFPSGYRDNILYELTKALADLTVRIAVKFTSPDRPEFVPGPESPYPCYNTRGQNSLHTGTGRVCHATKYIGGSETCPCPECEHSDTPSNVWWEVEVWTTKTVVFDDIEAKHSSCRLWFDEDQSPVVTIYGKRVHTSDTLYDRCKLYYVTHDSDVGYKLNKMVDRFFELRDKAWDKYKCNRGLEKLTIIVSHPHGCSKQVSIGHLVDRQWVGASWNIYTYTNCTCPGSSGALVYRLGRVWPNHPHRAAKRIGLNFSGVGLY